MRGRLGAEAKDTKEIRLLNRIIRITDKGLMYEADPTHAELLAKSMKMEQGRQVSTPGTKKGFSDDVMDLPIAHEPAVMACPIANVDERMPQVKFAEATPEVKHVIPYLEIYGMHPSKWVFDKNGSR